MMMNMGQSLSLALVAVAAAMVLLGTLYFASLRPAYSHISNTISELAKKGSVPYNRICRPRRRHYL